VRTWSLEDPAAPPVILLAQSTPVQALAYSLDGRFLIAGERNTNPLLLRADGSPAPPRPLAGYGDFTSVVTFCPDGCGRFLTAGHLDDTAKVGNLNALEAEPFVLRRPDRIIAASFDQAGRSLVTVDAGGAVLEWEVSDHGTNAATGPKHALQLPIFRSPIASLSTDLRRLALGGYDPT
jgi:hypothetical protein